MCSGMISAAGRDRLDELLRDDADNLYFYLIYMDLCAHLQWEFRVGLPAAGQLAALGHSDVEIPEGRCELAGGDPVCGRWRDSIAAVPAATAYRLEGRGRDPRGPDVVGGEGPSRR